MNLIVNGTPQAFENSLTVLKLITTLQLQPKSVVAEINGQIVEKDLWSVTTLKDNDKIELITFVGGG